MRHLLDHFRQIEKPSEEDSWTTDAILNANTQSIKEVFDDDGSGLITVAEVNRLVDSMPSDLGWRLALYLIPLPNTLERSFDTVCTTG